MFERFSEQARHVVVLAQEEARGLGHRYIGTEHLLLALLAEGEGVAAHALADLGVDVHRVREDVVAIAGTGSAPVTDQIPFTPRAKKVLELSLREAQALGAGHIGTEHLLLGLVRQGEGVAMRVLLEQGADAEQVRNTVVRQVSGGRPPVPGAPRPAVPRSVEIPLAPSVRRALELAAAAALRDGATTVELAQLLAALADQADPFVIAVLAQLESDPQRLAEAVARASGGPPQA